MKKKLLAILLTTVMAVSVTGCGGADDEKETTTKAQGTTTAASTDAPTTTPKPTCDTEEAITKDPVVFEDFESDIKGVVAVVRGNDDPSTGKPPQGTLPTADAAATAGKTLLTTESYNGSKALDLDGTYGAEVVFEKFDSQSYTLSFWFNPARFSEYSSLIILGQDFLEENSTCSWLSLTKTTWNATVGCPTIWSRSLQEDHALGLDPETVWPWYIETYFNAWTEGADLVKDTWYHVAIVVNGDEPAMDPVTGTEVQGCVTGYTYINGQHFGYGPVAKNCMTAASNFFLGINCWDPIQKIKVDNVAVYDYALTPGQVLSVFNSQK